MSTLKGKKARKKGAITPQGQAHLLRGNLVSFAPLTFKLGALTGNSFR